MELKNQTIEVSREDKWVVVKMEDLKPGEIFRIVPIEKKLKYTAYLHSEKETNYNNAKKFGLEDNEEFMNKFIYSLYEVELDMEVDTKTGESWILGIGGVKLEKPVKS